MLSLAACFTVGSFAQTQGTHELRVTAGVTSTNTFVHLFREVVSGIFKPDGLQREGLKSTPVLAMQYRYSASDAIALNVEGVFEHYETVYNYPQISTESTFVTIGAGADWYYLRSEGHSMGTINLYSGLNVAYTVRSSSGTYFTDSSLSDTTPFSTSGGWVNGQLTLLGFRAGNALGVNAELGFGYRGLVNGGISYRF